MSISSKDIVPLTRARAQLAELVEEVQTEGREKIITKNGESCAALINAERLDHYHRLEREHIHLTLLDEVLRGLDDLERGKTLGFAKFKSKHGR
ncbi:MAG: type II toxin-antitoxin system Phd/YefM family antitoxin [Acidobacteria bacterium]|nr:MAG: type II toxin-antitoxin system Phd/YefM family antitoxin [Acidobacteriota bacterium]